MSQMPYDSNAMPWDERNALAHAQPCTGLHIDTSQATELSGEIVGARTLKSVVQPQPQPTRSEYPRLMATIGWRQIMLLTEESKGVIIHDEDYPAHVGIHSSGWSMSEFIPFSGEVLLSN